MKRATLRMMLTIVVVALALGTAVSAAAPMGTAFTYQGRLLSGGTAVTATCDFEFSLWDDAAAGTQQGSTVPLTTSVDDGLFTVNLDFGEQFNGEARWLQLAVCCPSPCTVQPLTPRQELTPTPYVRYAATAGNADTVDGSHGCSFVGGTGYEETGDVETDSTKTLCGPFPKGCTIRLISTKAGSPDETADNGEAFGLYNQNWYDAVQGGWRVVAMTSDSTSVYTAAGINGNSTSTTIMSAGSCTLKDDTAAYPSDDTWVINDNDGTYRCLVYVCD